MGKDFQRGLSSILLQELLNGPCRRILRGCGYAGLDVRLRDDYLSVYFRGRSVARIVGRGRRPTRLEIHRKYLAGDRIGDFAGRRIGDLCVFEVDADFAAGYVAHLNEIIERARCHVGPEESVELRLLQRNDSEAAVCCFDRQVQVPGTRRTLDLMGLAAGDVPALVAIEVKRYPDRSIQYVPRQLHEYMGIFDPKRAGLRADVAESYRTVSEQLRVLGFSAPDPTQITEGMPVYGLVIVSNYKPGSHLLPRARELAAKLDRPMYLWQPADGEFLIPPLERCARMGRDEPTTAS